MEQGKEYGFGARTVWKRFVSTEDCLKKHEFWSVSLDEMH
jgi:hypothetical protein